MQPRFYDFGPFRIDPAKRLLLRESEPVSLKPKAFDTLLFLVQNRGRVVEKDEMLKALWPDTFVEEANLTQHISLVRKALGEKAGENRFILTIPGRGYQFVADVREIAEGDEAGESRVERSLSARFFRQALGWKMLTAYALLIAVAFTLGYVWNRRQSARAGEPVRSIAVLPFKSAGGSAEDEYVRLGLTEALISKFNGLSYVTVRQLSEVLKYNKPDADPLAAGRALAVDAVLDGVIQKSDGRIRLTARLLDVRVGETLWVQSFDEQWSDIFAMQDAIAVQISRTLAMVLTIEDRQRVARRHTNNAEAYGLYLQAAYLYGKRTAEAIEKSDEFMRRAIELDPNFALAYQGLAINYGFPRPFLSPREAQQKQKEYLRKALERDNTLGTSHMLMASLKWRGDLNAKEAEKYFRRAVELEPNNVNTRRGYGLFLAEQGRLDEGIREMELAQKLSPTSLSTMTVLAALYAYARRYDDAIRQYEKVLELDSSYSSAHAGLGWVRARKGAYEEALASLEKAAELETVNKSNVQAFFGYTFAKMGRQDETIRTLHQVEELRKHGQGSWGAMAVIYAAQSEKSQSLISLEKALEEREWWAFSIKVNPLFDDLRSDPRFDDLLRRIGLEP